MTNLIHVRVDHHQNWQVVVENLIREAGGVLTYTNSKRFPELMTEAVLENREKFEQFKTALEAAIKSVEYGVVNLHRLN